MVRYAKMGISESVYGLDSLSRNPDNHVLSTGVPTAALAKMLRLVGYIKTHRLV